MREIDLYQAEKFAERECHRDNQAFFSILLVHSSYRIQFYKTAKIVCHRNIICVYQTGFSVKGEEIYLVKYFFTDFILRRQNCPWQNWYVTNRIILTDIVYSIYLLSSIKPLGVLNKIAKFVLLFYWRQKKKLSTSFYLFYPLFFVWL